MKKSLGQHFLINKTAIQKIINALELQPTDTVIEIGPGRGALTFPLLEKCQRLTAIEKDESLANELKKNSGLKIITGDALKIIPKLIKKTKNCKIVGNIPYYITGKLLRVLSAASLERGKPRPENSGREPNLILAVLMVQKEVGERLTAKPPRMNLLAAATQFWTTPKIIFTLKPKDFNPLPKVESAVIKLKTKDTRHETRETENYYKLLPILFKQPRKTIFNNLRTGLKLLKNEIENSLKSLKIEPNSRPQNLSIEQIKALSNLFTFPPTTHLHGNI